MSEMTPKEECIAIWEWLAMTGSINKTSAMRNCIKNSERATLLERWSCCPACCICSANCSICPVGAWRNKRNVCADVVISWHTVPFDFISYDHHEELIENFEIEKTHRQMARVQASREIIFDIRTTWKEE